MRKVLLLFCILSITFCAKAQFFGNGVTKLEKDWVNGAYFDLAGIKHPGLILWHGPDAKTSETTDVILYKTDKKANENKLSTADIKGFIYDRDNDGTIDTFTVTTNKLFEHAPIIAVLAFKNNLKLYCSSVVKIRYSAGSYNNGIYSSGERYEYLSSTYYIGPDINNVTLLDKNNFIEMMPLAMADNADAVTRIKNKKLKYSDM